MRLDSADSSASVLAPAPRASGGVATISVPAVRDADAVLHEVLLAAAASDELRRRQAPLTERVDAARTLFLLTDELVDLRRAEAHAQGRWC